MRRFSLFASSSTFGHLPVQDHDGSHIKGLIINFIHTFWPSLLRNPSFMLEFITPIVKVCMAHDLLSWLRNALISFLGN